MTDEEPLINAYLTNGATICRYIARTIRSLRAMKSIKSGQQP